jgi:HEAT repeat protein
MVQPAAARALLAMGCEGALAVPLDELSRGGTNTLPGACVSDFKVRVLWEALSILRAYGGPAAAGGFGFLPEAGPEERAAAAARAVAWWRGRPADLAVERRARFDDPGFVAGVQREIRILGEYKFLEMDRSRRALILLGRPALPHLVAAVAAPPAADPSGQRRIGACQVLASIGDASAIPALRAAFQGAEIAPVRCQALVALAALLPPGGVPEAVRLLASGRAEERSAAAEALALCPTPGSAGSVTGLLAAPDADPVLRIHLATALLAGRDPAGLPVLLGYLADPDVVLRRRAWAGIDRWTEGLGPFDPESGTGVEGVTAGRDAWMASPRFRERTVPGR